MGGSSSSFSPEKDNERANGYDSDGLFNGAAATSAAHHSSHGLAGERLHRSWRFPRHCTRFLRHCTRFLWHCTRFLWHCTRFLRHCMRSLWHCTRFPMALHAVDLPCYLFCACLACTHRGSCRSISALTRTADGISSQRCKCRHVTNQPASAGNGNVRGEGGSSRPSRATGPGGIPSAPGSFSGGFSGFEDGDSSAFLAPLISCSHYVMTASDANERHASYWKRKLSGVVRFLSGQEPV